MAFGSNPFGSGAFGSGLSAVEASEAASDAMASGEVVLVQFIHLAFSPTPIALNSSTWDLVWNGVTYKGAYGLGTVSPVKDSPGELQGLTIELFGDAATVALALDGSDTVQGTVLTVRTAIISPTTYQVLDAPVEWVGELDTMGISEDGERCVINVAAESKAIDLLRGTPMFYSDADQKTVNATDGMFKYVIDQIDKDIVWPARGYFLR